MFIVYYIYCFRVLVVAIFIGIISGFLAFLWSLLIGKRKIQMPILVGIGAFFLVICGVLGYWEYLTYDYENYGGDFDYYRIPLDYPYQLSMIDEIDCASITVWKNDNHSIVKGITHYHKQENIVVGKISADCFLADKSAWFSFDTTTGIAIKYETEEEYHQALKELGFNEEPTLPMIRENGESNQKMK